jgi:hypothetical protein
MLDALKEKCFSPFGASHVTTIKSLVVLKSLDGNCKNICVSTSSYYLSNPNILFCPSGLECASQGTFFYGRSGILRYTIQNMIKIGPHYGTHLSLQVDQPHFAEEDAEERDVEERDEVEEEPI